MRKIKKITGTVITIAALAAMNISVFATTEADNKIPVELTVSNMEAGIMPERGERPELTEEQKAEMQAKMKERLAEQLEAGTITQEQYDQQISNIEAGIMPERGERPELTEEQKAEMQAKMKERLAGQLEAGTITQEQYDQSISDIESGTFPMRGNRKDIKNTL